MLPPVDFLSKCLRCQKPLADDEQVCAACGADRDVEREVYGQLMPAISQLRTMLAVVAVVSAVIALVVYQDARSHGLDGMRAALPFGTGALIFGALWSLAPRAPLVTALIGQTLVVGEWLRTAIDSPFTAFSPGIGLVLRVLLVVALGVAIKAGWNARRLRGGSRIPAARAR